MLHILMHIIVGIDEVLAEHIAHLFIRDPISLFEEKLDLNDEEEVDHFEVSISTQISSPFYSCCNCLECTYCNILNFISTN